MKDSQRKAMFANAKKSWNTLGYSSKYGLKEAFHLDSDVNVKYNSKSKDPRAELNKGVTWNKLSLRDKKILSEVHF